MSPEKLSSQVVRAEKKPLSIVGIPLTDYSYAQKSHFKRLKIKYGEEFPRSTEVLKYYQDLTLFAFISENVQPGSRLLEIGGGNSRILNFFKGKYECWNLDKFEGVGNGPKDKPDNNLLGYTWVDGYAGDFHKGLKDSYFDLVFSISVLEHIPQDSERLFDDIVADCNRVIKPGAFSIHLIDMVMPGWRHPFIDYSFKIQPMLTELISFSDIKKDHDLYIMTKKEYESRWMNTTNKSYEDFGQPSSYNLIWKKQVI